MAEGRAGRNGGATRPPRVGRSCRRGGTWLLLAVVYWEMLARVVQQRRTRRRLATFGQLILALSRILEHLHPVQAKKLGLELR